MCGICGIAGQVDAPLLEQMTRVIAHRGPDDEGIYLSPGGKVGLGNRRLAIIDLSPAGHMPMPSDDKILWITYNGEVYNFPELRARLQQRGYAFRSATDTEVVLYLYREYGVEAFARLNGMFALAIWDEGKQELVLARDRFGIKPLYYAVVDGNLIFSSEIKSILLDPRFRRELDLESLNYYLAHLWVPGPGTMLKGIYKLPPGHYLRWRAGQVEVCRFWEISWNACAAGSPQELSAELRRILYQAVERHLLSDVPLGLYLSGGLDSTILLALMSQITGAPVDAYTIAFRSQDAELEQSAGEDAYYAEFAARHYRANFHRIDVDPDITQELPVVLWHLDEPVADPAAINTLLIARQARSDVKVLLSGQGADEVFGGYRVHLVERFARFLRPVPRWLRESLLRPALGTLPGMPGVPHGLGLAFQRYFDKVLAGVDLSPEDNYLFNRTYYTQAELLALYAPDRRAEFEAMDSLARHRATFAELPDADFVNRMLHVDLKTFLPELNLTYGDRLSMAASVEMRVPYLDGELVDFMSRVPPELKIHRLTGKYILRKAVAGLVPHEIIRRRKAGFGAPIRRWLRHDLQPMVEDLLCEDTIRRRGYFDPVAVRGLIERDRQGQEDNTYRIWALLTLELWLQIFIDQKIRVV